MDGDESMERLSSNPRIKQRSLCESSDDGGRAMGADVEKDSGSSTAVASHDGGRRASRQLCWWDKGEEEDE